MNKFKFENLERVGTLIKYSEALLGFDERYKEKISQSAVDKYGRGFAEDDRFTCFTLPAVRFSAYYGTYGSSSCYSFFSIDGKEIEAAYKKWLNKNMGLILDGIGAELKATADSIVSEARDELSKAANYLEEVTAA